MAWSNLIFDEWHWSTNNDSDLTVGPFETETDAEADLDRRLEATGSFQIFKQVAGRYLFSRPCQEMRTPRIDRIIVPSPKLVQAGWGMGPVGIECKKSKVKIGRPISQAIDYSRAAWKMGRMDTWVTLDRVFIWPMGSHGGPIGSILSQQRIGSLFGNTRDGLTFYGGQHPLANYGGGEWEMYPEYQGYGAKSGSR